MSKEYPVPKRLHRTVVYECPWYGLYQDRVEFPGGYIIEKYQILETEHHVVGAVVENDKGEILMVKIPRYPTQRIEWEIPGGSIDEGEEPIAAGVREVCEETGYQTKNQKMLCTYNPVNGYSNEEFFLIHCEATGTPCEEIDKNEVLEVRWFTKAEILGMIEKNELKDGLTLMGLLRFFMNNG
jgi:8-oxo-dGTP pyrophosphatase MutT (NUDIX family)